MNGKNAHKRIEKIHIEINKPIQSLKDSILRYRREKIIKLKPELQPIRIFSNIALTRLCGRGPKRKINSHTNQGIINIKRAGLAHKIRLRVRKMVGTANTAAEIA
jgi:hypothetical protein